jgi:hypothetical protein
MGGGNYSSSVLENVRRCPTIESVREVVVPAPVGRLAQKLRGVLSRRRTFYREVLTSPQLRALLSRPDTYENIDFLILNGGDQFRAIERTPSSVPLVYVMHNREEHYIKTTISHLAWHKRLVVAATREVAKSVEEEAQVLRRATAVIAISIEELEFVEATHPGVRGVWVPPTFGSPPPARPRPSEQRIVLGMIGSVDWFPNRAAVEFLIQEAWPAADHRVHLLLAGKDTERFSDPKSRITGLGFVDDVRDFWGQIDVFVAPIQHGAGTNVKVCEALWNRTPMLATPRALRGLPPFEDEGVRVLDSVEAWVSALQWESLTSLAGMQPSTELASWFDPNTVIDRVDSALNAAFGRQTSEANT